MEKFLRNHKYFIKDDFKIEINPVSKIAWHTHDFIEFVYMLKGNSVHIVNGQKFSMQSGDMLIINYNQQHSFNGDPTAEFCNILIKPTFVDEALKECTDLFSLFETAPYSEFKNLINASCNFISFSNTEKSEFEHILFMTHKELTERSVGFNVIAKAGMNTLLTLIFRKMSQSLSANQKDFQIVLEHIEKNYAENITIKELSAICNYNASYFSRYFKKYTGITFLEYLKRTRILNACKLLEGDGFSVSEIYAKVGYTNRTNFYKHFKQLIGQTPLKYRKQAQKRNHP